MIFSQLQDIQGQLNPSLICHWQKPLHTIITTVSFKTEEQDGTVRLCRLWTSTLLCRLHVFYSVHVRIFLEKHRIFEINFKVLLVLNPKMTFSARVFSSLFFDLYCPLTAREKPLIKLEKTKL